MKKLMILLLLMAALFSGCDLCPEADIRIVGWDQPWVAYSFESKGYPGYYPGLVEVIYEVENTGSIDIHDFEFRIVVTCTDTFQYWTRIERSVTVKSGDTFQETVLINVSTEEAGAVTLTYIDYNS